MILFVGCGSSQSRPSSRQESSSGQEAAVEQQPKTGIQGEEVSYQADGVTLKGYLAYNADQADKRPGVLVVHEWWGHNDYARKRARMLAEMGYTALALDMFGEGKNTTHPETAKQFVGEVLKDANVGEVRFNAALSLLKAHDTVDPDKIAAIGYCFGAGVVLHMARVGADLNAVASFHGSLDTNTPAKRGTIKAKLLVQNGGADPFVPPALVKKFKNEMKKAKADLTFINYPGAKHAFTNPEATELGKENNLPLAYDKAADEKSWQELKLFLEKIFH
ncbi:MAG: dienelactone hydrolase family protein [Myxococcales bacterium]|nr:MAG: dienelactone hydrolase family protein [Myxococcales bacterium]